MSRKLIAFVLGALALAVMPVAYADFAAQRDGYGSEQLQTIICGPDLNLNGTPTNDACESIGSFGPNQYIKGFKLLAVAASSAMALYDAATVGSNNPFEELYEATAGETALHIWPSPYKLTTDLSVVVTGANSLGVIYY